MRYLVLVALLGVAGCAETINMRNPQTGAVVQCGPYRTTGSGADAAAMRSSQCINDYKQQGYVRAP